MLKELPHNQYLELFFQQGLLAFFVSLVVIPVLIKSATTFGLLDKPDHETSTKARKIHPIAIPRIGGLGILLGFLVSKSLLANVFVPYWLIVPGILFFLVGFLDDLISLPARMRLFGQIAFALLMVIWGNLGLNSVTLWSGQTILFPGFVGTGLSVFIVVGAVNCINMIDGLDGLAAGIGVIAMIGLGLIHHQMTGDPYFSLLLIIPAIGAWSGFIKHNFHPASIFMGDGGSYLLGFLLGSFLILTTLGVRFDPALGDVIRGPNGQPVSFYAVPFVNALLCLSVPVLDTAKIILTRILNGKSLVKPDQNHLHHFFMRKGFSHLQCVLIIYSLATTGVLFGVVPLIWVQSHLSWLSYLVFLVLAAVIISSKWLDRTSEATFFCKKK